MDSFIGQNASVAERDSEMLQTTAVLDSASVDGSFSAVTTLPSSGQPLFMSILEICTGQVARKTGLAGWAAN